MPRTGTREIWKKLQIAGGSLIPGFLIESSSVPGATFSILSNSGGGKTSKDYDRQLEIFLHALKISECLIQQIEVDSARVESIPMSQKILQLNYPIEMASVPSIVELRRKIGSAQQPIGQMPDIKKGNRTRRIRIHVTSSKISAETFANEIIPSDGRLRLIENGSVTASDVKAQISTLSNAEIQSVITEWGEIGRDAFFEKYNVNPALKYKINSAGNEFDAKAIVVGALKRFRMQLGNFETSIFDGNANTIAKPLRQLGFDVLDLELEKIEIDNDNHQKEIEQRGFKGATEILQLIKSRRGQGVFRDNVEALGARCRITGVTNLKYLRASHIKPWRKSTDQEKIDGNNGLLLAPHIDMLFDAGFISFENDGTLIVSAQIEPGLLTSWGISQNLNVGLFSSRQSFYLEHHRSVELNK